MTLDDMVSVDGRGNVLIANLSAIDNKSLILRYLKSELSKKRFSAVSSKARSPLLKREGVYHVISLTNLKIIVNLLKVINIEEVGEFDSKLVFDILEEAKKLFEIAVKKKVNYNELNSCGNVSYVDEF
jgi:hypothetical protein